MAHGSHPIHQQDINAGVQLELLQSVRTNDTHLLSDWRASVSGQDAVVSQPFVSSKVCKLSLLMLVRGELSAPLTSSPAATMWYFGLRESHISLLKVGGGQLASERPNVVAAFFHPG